MRNWIPFALVVVLSALAFAPTLQTIPNGSSHYFMIDVGEMQIVLNNWGSPHATAYPLYVMTGNIFTDIFTAFGVSQVTAPALVSWMWGLFALAVLYALAVHLSGGRIWLSGAMVLLFALTRGMWIHFVVAEIYTFALLMQAGLLALALWRPPIRGRVYWLALLGGLALAHHRATIVFIPALLFAVWPIFNANRRAIPKMVLISGLLGLLGMTQYAYTYLRARSGADWIYGEPGTLSGLWDEIIGREAERFIGLPASFDAFWEHFIDVNVVLIRDLTVPGIIVGIVGLLWALRQDRHRRAAQTFIILAISAYLFHSILYSDVLTALILPITLGLAFGWLYLATAIVPQGVDDPRRLAIPLTAAVLLGVYLVAYNTPFIREQTFDPTGIDTIEEVRSAPEGSTVMLAWGPRYFAVAAAQILQGDLTHLTIIDDKVDYRAIETPIITPEYTFFNQPPEWFADRLGWSAVYLEAVAPNLVILRDAPRIGQNAVEGVVPVEAVVVCGDPLVLDVIWQAGTPPEADLSVFVHGLDVSGQIIAQGDQFAPVYGWRPFSTWTADEQVRDIYPLAPTVEGIVSIRYGLYRTLDTGFENVYEYEITVDCEI